MENSQMGRTIYLLNKLIQKVNSGSERNWVCPSSSECRSCERGIPTLPGYVRYALWFLDVRHSRASHD